MNSHWGNLIIGSYKNKNIDPLMPILQQEFPNWNSKRIKSYMDLVNNESSEVSGVLAAKNEFGYYVGCLIFTYQQIDHDRLNGSLNNNSNEISNVFVVENINSCIPILQKQIFLALVDEAANIAKIKNCNYIELPTLSTNSYELVKKKYDNKIQNSKTFRTYIKV
jgi:hypothetical protein